MKQGPWTDDEVRALKYLAEKGATQKMIAEALGRTEGSVSCKKQSLNISAKNRWTEKDDETMLRMMKSKTTVAEMARTLGRTKQAIIHRGVILRERNPIIEEKEEPIMTEQEIAKKVKNGVDIQILAELNLKTKKEIKKIARKYGVDVS